MNAAQAVVVETTLDARGRKWDASRGIVILILGEIRERSYSIRRAEMGAISVTRLVIRRPSSISFTFSTTSTLQLTFLKHRQAATSLT